MEELDKLKKDWQKSADLFPKYTESDLYKMLHKKSSSIVKWIFIISMIEFASLLIISFLLKDNSANKQFENYDVEYITVTMSIIGYAIMIYFFYKFYTNYRKITSTDNVKKLMATILNTRKVVNLYILVNIIWFIISCIVVLVILFKNDAMFNQALQKHIADGTEVSFYIVYIIITILCLALLGGAVWLFYKLIYGLLLKRLHRNYNELKKIDL